MNGQSSQVASSRVPAQKTYFVNPLVDFLLIGGASLLLFVAYLFFKWPREMVWPIAYTLSFCCNYPHFAATSYRLYHTSANRAQYPWTAYGVPVLLLALTAGAFAWPLIVAPALVKLYLLWSPYHYSAQTMGITLIYARRSGMQISPGLRRMFVWFVFGTFISINALAEAGMTQLQYFGIQYPALGLPRWIAVSAQMVMIVGAIGMVVGILYWIRKTGQRLPAILLLPATAQFFWFIPGSRMGGFSEFVPFFHGLQYLLIAWMMQLEERRMALASADAAVVENPQALANAPLREPPKRFIRAETFHWGLGILFAGVLLFEILPRMAAWSTGLSIGISMAVILSVVQIHHFFVDGVIWKLRNPAVASPLMVNLDNLLHADKVPEKVAT